MDRDAVEADPRQRFQVALGSAYAIERELGGGGMSRVFLAQETTLGRQVVIKVVAPELAAVLSTERFAREVERPGSDQGRQGLGTQSLAALTAFNLHILLGAAHGVMEARSLIVPNVALTMHTLITGRRVHI